MWLVMLKLDVVSVATVAASLASPQEGVQSDGSWLAAQDSSSQAVEWDVDPIRVEANTGQMLSQTAYRTVDMCFQL